MGRSHIDHIRLAAVPEPETLSNRVHRRASLAPQASPPPVTYSMHFRFPGVVDLTATVVSVSLAVCMPAAAQVIQLSPGQTVSGRLEASDERLADDSFYDFYEYRGQPGEVIEVTLRSSDFDAYLQGGPAPGGDVTLEDSDDDGAGGTDARMRATIDGSGVYRIVANSYGAGQAGAYTVSLESISGGSRGGSSGANALRAGETVSGRLDASDAQLSDESFYDLYEYRGQPGEAIVVTLRSSDFDAYLQGGPASGSDLSPDDTDDDGAGGTDARLTATVGATGVYRIRANSLGAGQSGAYTLTLESNTAGGGATGGGATGGGSTLRAGQTVSGALSSSDGRLTDDSYFDLYEYRGQAGESIVVTLRSSDFDAYLQGGPASGADISVEDSDDDGAGGTDARLSATVGASGVYRVRANSYGGGQTGSYTLSLQSTSASGAASDVVRSGQTVAGRLESGDTQFTDNSYFDTYYYDGAPGDRLLVTLTSSDFDTFLMWGQGEGSAFEASLSDDDGAGGTNSRLEVTVSASGRYVVQANSYGEGGIGAYSLSVESLGSDTGGFPTIGLGQTVNSRLDDSDAVRSDDSLFEVYVYQGQPGEQVLVTLRSSDFDAYLQTGRQVGGNFEADESDDDSGGGTDSQILATVGGGGVLTILANTYAAGGAGDFSLTVESLSGANGTNSGGRAASLGLPTAAPGTTSSGTLTSGDGMLADSSFYDQVVYAGNPGDRVRITLSSSDFDAYLGWGRIDESGFSGDLYDDDGAGGTNAQLEVTADGSGLFGILVNSYVPGQSGSYTLSLERLAAAPVSSAPVSGEAGKWMYAYEEPFTTEHRSLSQRAKRNGALEEIAALLQQRYVLPRPVELSFDTCEMVNAFYNPRESDITFCYELLEFLSDVFVPDDQWTEEQRSNVFGAVEFIMMHEVGHALIDVLDLPITGREEDVADQLAVYVLVRGGDKGAAAALAGVSALQPSSTSFSETALADEHSLEAVRLYNVMCWIYGSDPNKYGGLVTSGSLPEARAVRCPGEWDQMAKAWQRLLADYRP
jgi:Putative metallopeptidase